MKLTSGIVALVALLAAPAALASDPIKIGFVCEFSGPFAAYGRQIRNGIRAYLKEHGDTVAGRKIEIIERDTTGPSPEVAKRLAQDLVVNEKVDFLAGFSLTPNALAAAPIATQGRTPMVIMNAATSVVTTKSPYIVRLSMTLPQVTEPMALWAAKNGIKKVYSIVSDFAPFVQRAKDSKPDAVFVFIPAGEQAIAFVKAFTERGLKAAGIKLIGPGDVTDDDVLEAMGAPTLGIITTHHYSFAHDSPQNAAFRKAYASVAGANERPNFMAVGGYDGMAAIAEVVKKLGGKMDPDKAMELFKSYKTESPRGPIEIDPQTRDIIQSVYVRRVEQKNGQFVNVEIDRFPHFKDPGKEAMKEAAK